MPHYDVFNGDADGLCALQQLRLADLCESLLITGVKRDIALLDRVPVEAATGVTVLDISLDKNRAALERLLAANVPVCYVDHHVAGKPISHPALDLHLGTLPDRGTSLLVDEMLNGRFRAWAVVGTFGDNFDQRARQAAAPLGLTDRMLESLRELGILLNYNGYGETVADLHVAPDALFRRIQPYADPFDLIAGDGIITTLREGYAADMAQARTCQPECADAGHRLFILPDQTWSRRVSGVFANELAQQSPNQAHAILTRSRNGCSVVSVRAPLAHPAGADVLCRAFATGGGRQAAAGINALPEQEIDHFVEAFLAAFETHTGGAGSVIHPL